MRDIFKIRQFLDLNNSSYNSYYLFNVTVNNCLAVIVFLKVFNFLIETNFRIEYYNIEYYTNCTHLRE